MTIYNEIQSIENPSLEEKEKVKESTTTNFLQNIRLLKEEHSPHKTEEEVKSDAYFRYLKALANSLDIQSSVYKVQKLLLMVYLEKLMEALEFVSQKN